MKKSKKNKKKKEFGGQSEQLKDIEQRPSIEDVLPHQFWLEKYRKMELFEPKLIQNFVPNLKNSLPEEKFYSKYNNRNQLTDDYDTRRYREFVERFFYGGPKQRYGYEVLESHVYGWYSEPFKYDKFDYGRVFKPRIRGELSEFAEKLSTHKVTERPQYNGIEFKLF